MYAMKHSLLSENGKIVSTTFLL